MDGIPNGSMPIATGISLQSYSFVVLSDRQACLLLYRDMQCSHALFYFLVLLDFIIYGVLSKLYYPVLSGRNSKWFYAYCGWHKFTVLFFCCIVWQTGVSFCFIVTCNVLMLILQYS